MREPTVDDRFFPLVVNTIPERLDADHLPAFFAKTEAILKRREPYVTLSDVTRTRELPTAVVRRALADWSTRHDAAMKQFAMGTAIVIESAMIRGGLTALFWLAPPPYPQQVVATIGEGLDVVRRYYEATGRTAPGFDAYRAELRGAARAEAR